MTIEVSTRVIDIREVDHRALGLSSATEKVNAKGNEVDIKINSNTEVSKFRLEQESKSIFFTTEGADRTQGATIICIGSGLYGLSPRNTQLCQTTYRLAR